MNPTTTQYELSFASLYSEHRQRLVGLAEHLGCPGTDAQDAVQDIFTAVLRRGHQTHILAMPAPWQATHLNLMLRSHLTNLWRNARAQKRAGAAQFIVWEDACDEALQLATTTNPSTEHDRMWLCRTLEQAMAIMQQEAKASVWHLLNDWLTDITYASSSPQRGADRIALHRAKVQLRVHILHVAASPTFAALKMMA